MIGQGPNMGRMVRYVLKSGRSAGQSRAAMVVRDWSEKGNGCVNLHVFLDGSNDKGAEGTAEVYPTPERVALPKDDDHMPGSYSKYAPLTVWVTSADFSEEKTPGTWHWPTIVR